jgi:superfamily I DNA and RNA helicase
LQPEASVRRFDEQDDFIVINSENQTARSESVQAKMSESIKKRKIRKILVGQAHENQSRK